MRGPIRSVLMITIMVCAVEAFSGAASAATLGQPANLAFEAIYGNPPTTGPVGGGLGASFGFGENMLFEACAGCTPAVGENVSITLPGPQVSTATESYVGGTLTSNKTGANNALSLSIQLVDFQHVTFNGVAAPWYTDTSDRPWITEICAPGADECNTDPLFKVKKAGVQGEGRTVQINDVSINIGSTGSTAAFTFQGTVWGVWENGTALAPACIKLELPPKGTVPTAAGDQTLIITKAGATSGEAVGNKIEAIKGKFCLISSNNDWNHSEKTAITIANT